MTARHASVGILSLEDPRLYQILALASLLIIGVGWRGFDVNCIAVVMGSALATQYLFTLFLRLPVFDPKSALITSLSLCILLRTNSLIIAALAAAVAIASKFLLRVGGKHIFNPANFAITLFLAFNLAWISPAQWGSATWYAFLFCCLGITVITRAKRADITITFLACYLGLIWARAWWLGDPMAIPLKQMQSGALLLFAFFMISDPKTTPNAFSGRVLFAAIVAFVAFLLQYVFYIPTGLMVSLVLLSPLVVIIDKYIEAPSYNWIKSQVTTI